MVMGDYLNFDLEITRLSRGKYLARVTESPAGEAATEFRRPFSDLELENFVLRIGRTRTGTRRLNSPEMQAAEVFGKKLFDAVFQAGVRECLTSSLHQIDRNEIPGLRLRLRLVGVPELSDLPWEYLYHTTLRRFLVLSVQTPIIRYTDLPHPVKPLAVSPPLQLLVMVASPADYPELDVDQERTKIESALHDLVQRDLIAIEWLEKPTLYALQQRLRRNPVHLFHFIGHGGWDPQEQDGVLLFEDDQGRGRKVGANHLATILRDHRSLRLVVLNACEGGRASPTDPFAGVAGTLVQQGIPAVLAMQFEITDHAAIELAQVFYDSLAVGLSAEAALAEARKAIYASGNDVEWGTPVLYLRAPEGRLFDLTLQTNEQVDVKVPNADVMPTSVHASEIVSEIDARQAKLSELYQQGIQAFKAQDWRKAINRFKALLVEDASNSDASEKLAHAERQFDLFQQEQARLAKLQGLYEAGREAMTKQAWQSAIHAFQQIMSLQPNYQDTAGLLVEAATKQRELEETQARETKLSRLYTQVLEWQSAEDWPKMIVACEEIIAIDSNYQDVVNLLTQARKAKKQAEVKKAEQDRLAREQDEQEQLGKKKVVIQESVEPKMSRTRSSVLQITAKNIRDVKLVHSFTGHTDAVWTVAFSPDGTLLASGSKDYSIRLWGVSDRKLIRALKGHTSFVHRVAFSPDGTLLASASWDNTVRIWNVSNGTVVHTLGEHKNSVDGVAFSPDGKWLASSTWAFEDTVRIWRVSNGTMVHVLKGHTNSVPGVAFSPDGTLLASASTDKTVRLWQVADGKLIRTFTSHEGGVNSVAFSPDGNVLASGSTDKTVRLWRVSDGATVHVLKGHTGDINTVAFSPDGSLLASGSQDQSVRLWTVSNGAHLITLTGHTKAVNGVAFSPDGTLLASGSGGYWLAGDSAVKLWGITGKLKK